MIKTLSISKLRYEKDFDEAYAIVRSMKNPIKDVVQITELSPSWTLFKTYLNLKENKNWCQNTFDTIYTPQFYQQIANDKDAQKWLDKLVEDSKTKTILLLCFCPDKNLCHRSLIGNLLKNRGADVIID